MTRALKIFSAFAIVACLLAPQAGAAASEKRLALVIGNASYKAQPLVTAVNDAALVSQALQSAGFEVTGLRDLDQNLLRDAVRSFTSKIANAGPAAVVFVYFAGYAVQLAGENYLIPVGTDISDVTGIPARTLALSDLMHALSALKPQSTFIVLDAGRPGPFVLAGQAGGLAWTEPAANMLIAFSTAPGTSARDSGGRFGSYARALAEMIGEAGLEPANLFDRVRLRVNQLTAGGQVPWDASRIETSFQFRELAPDTEPDAAASRTAQLRLQSMRALGAQNAYMIALLRDTFDAYADFLADYWQDPMTKRVRALLAARRESITWERTCQSKEAVAYWSYLERYPNGPHAAEASRLLAQMGVATTLPAKFVRMDYDVPPPLPDELEYIARPTLILDDPSFGLENPPPIPAEFLGPPPRELADLKPPAASQGHTLPVLNLPVLASSGSPHDGKVSSNSSSHGDEIWAMKPAFDVPRGPQKQAAISSASSLLSPGSATNPATSPANANPTQPKAQDARNGNQALTQEDNDPSAQHEGSASALKSTSQVAPAMPAWLTDVVTARSLKDSPGPSVIGRVVLQSAPSMFASASAGLTFQTWRHWRHRSRPIVRDSVPIVARTATLPPSSAGLPAQPSANRTSPSYTTGSIGPTPRAVPPPAAGRSPSKPGLDQPALPSIAAAPMKPRRKHSTIKPPPTNQAARDPHESAASSRSEQ